MITQDRDVKKRRRAALSKMAILLAFTVLVWLFLTAAWFTMNKDVSGTGANVKVGTDPYLIVPLEGRDSIYTSYQNLIEGDNTDGFMVWKMTDENNMDNYDENSDAGILPSSFGKIGFYVKPSSTSIDLDLTFQIVGYKYTKTTDEDTNEETETMTQVNDELMGYLDGHILLFEERTATTTNGKTTYTYSKPILSDNDFNRVISNRTFLKANENTPVYIYWVWAETLSTLVDARTNSGISTVPLCVDDPNRINDAYDQIINEILTKPTRYFYKYSTTSLPYSADVTYLE